MSAIPTLSDLIERLYLETEDYKENPSDAQLWYNRGYANGVVAFFRANGFDDKLPGIELDPADIHAKETVMEWQKAYHHGFEMGERESGEVYQQHG